MAGAVYLCAVVSVWIKIMECESPQLLLPTGLSASFEDCGVCYACCCKRRLNKMRAWRLYRDKIRNYGGSYVKEV